MDWNMSRGDEITGSGQLGNGAWANVSLFSINKGNHLPEGETESSIIKFQTQWQPSLIHHENQYTAWPAWSCVLTQVLVLGQWEHYLSLVGVDGGCGWGLPPKDLSLNAVPPQLTGSGLSTAAVLRKKGSWCSAFLSSTCSSLWRPGSLYLT